MKPNAWLTDDSFIKETTYPDTYYLSSLCYKISAFIKNIPVHTIASYDPKKHRIFFMVGEEKKGFFINNEVSTHDFLTEVSNFLQQFYPQWDIKLEKEVDLTDDEMYQEINAGKDINDVALMKKKIHIPEKGIIEKMFIGSGNAGHEDTFYLRRNGIIEIRISGTLKNPITVSDFLSQCRKIKDGKELYSFVEENSTFYEYHDEKPIDIKYSGKMMKNFFLINKKYIDSTPVKISDFVYSWDRFRVYFDSSFLKDDCLSLFI